MSKNYALASSDEAARLQLQHQNSKRCHGNRSVFAPVCSSDGSRSICILDSGCHDGYWLQDLKKSRELDYELELYGTDLCIEEDVTTIDGISLSRHDVRQEWPKEWQEKFDLVHQRLILPFINGSHHEGVITRLCQLVKPGGWIQLEERVYEETKDQLPMSKKLNKLMENVANTQGCPSNYSDSIESYLKKNGFRFISDMIYHTLIGRVAPLKDDSDKEKTIDALLFAFNRFIEIAKTSNPSLIEGIDAEKLRKDIITEFKQKGGSYASRIIWAQKPNNDI